MREHWARIYAVAMGAVVVGLAALFAERQNALPQAPPPRTEARPAAPVRPVDPALVERGRELIESVGCLRCHRLEGRGSPRSPLDGVGGRLPPERIRAFIVADPSVRRALSTSVTRAKSRYGDLPDRDLDALIALLVASRGDGGP